MHCLLFNVTKMLWQIWSGTKLPGDSTKDSDYILSDYDLQCIQKSITSSVPQIPYNLGTILRSLLNSGFFKAAQWKAFLSVLGAAVLYKYLPPDAHRNFCNLQVIWLIATMSTITPAAMTALKLLVVQFVQDYEAIYYRKDENRLPVCRVNIHWILYLPACIEQNGPSSCNWSYPIERYAYEIKLMAAAKQHINTSVANQSIQIE
jgi:hypothetical protein